MAGAAEFISRHHKKILPHGPSGKFLCVPARRFNKQVKRPLRHNASVAIFRQCVI